MLNAIVVTERAVIDKKRMIYTLECTNRLAMPWVISFFVRAYIDRVGLQKS